MPRIPPGHRSSRSQAREHHAHARTGAKLLDFGLAPHRGDRPRQPGWAGRRRSQRQRADRSRGRLSGRSSTCRRSSSPATQPTIAAHIFALRLSSSTRWSPVTARISRKHAHAERGLGDHRARSRLRSSSVQPLAPRSLERLIAACIAKDPEDRLQTARDLKRAVRVDSDLGHRAASASNRRTSRTWIPWAAAAAVCAVILATELPFKSARSARPQATDPAGLALDHRTAERRAASSRSGLAPRGRPRCPPDGAFVVVPRSHARHCNSARWIP